MKPSYIFGMITLGCCAFLSSCTSKTDERYEGRDVPPPVEVKTEVDKATATTGDPIRYTLTASSEPGIEVEIPEMGSQIAGLRIVDLGETGPIERDGRSIIERWYQLKADLIGSYIIPGAVFSYTDETGKKKELKTAQIFIEVKSVIEDKETVTDIKDIKPLAMITRDYTLLIGLSVAGLVLLTLIAGGIYFYHTKYRSAKITPLRPAHELALEEIDRLQKEELIKRGIYQEHYFKLSEIFRRYLERRFYFQAVEQTTEEILPHIWTLKDFDENVKSRAQKFLHHTDLVKFAKYIPDTNEVDQEHHEAVSFIRATREVPTPLTSADEKQKRSEQE